MIAGWRICRARYATGAYSGRGAADYGGRWNRPGIPVVYTSSSLSLATLEYLVNIDGKDLPPDLVVIAAQIPDDITVARVEARDLPADWRSSPSPVKLKEIGEGWLRKAETAVLIVPSAVIPEENNLLLNPAHPQFARILIGKPKRFVFDPPIRGCFRPPCFTRRWRYSSTCQARPPGSSKAPKLGPRSESKAVR